MLTIIGLSGSTRRGSFNSALLRWGTRLAVLYPLLRSAARRL